MPGDNINLSEFEMLKAQHMIMSDSNVFSITSSDSSYESTLESLHALDAKLKEKGLSFNRLESAEIIISDMEKWPEVGRAFNEFCEGKHPIMTSVAEKNNVNSEFKVEIRVNALLQ